MTSTEPPYSFQAVPVPSGSNTAVSSGDSNDHRACDAEIATLRALAAGRDAALAEVIQLRAENARLRAVIREHDGWPEVPDYGVES
jgi:hypothetical protein